MDYIAYLMTQDLMRRQLEAGKERIEAESVAPRATSTAWRCMLARLLRGIADVLEPGYRPDAIDAPGSLRGVRLSTRA